MNKVNALTLNRLLELNKTTGEEVVVSPDARSLLMERIHSLSAVPPQALEISPYFEPAFGSADAAPVLHSRVRVTLLHRIMLFNPQTRIAEDDDILWSASWKFAVGSAACALVLCFYAATIPPPSATAIDGMFTSTGIF